MQLLSTACCSAALFLLGTVVCPAAHAATPAELVRAVQLGDMETLRNAGPAELNAQDEAKGTPLVWASYLGDLEAAKALGSSGADPNVSGIVELDESFYGSSLVAAVCEGHMDLARYLVEELSADVNAAEMQRSEDEIPWRPLDAAVGCGWSDFAEYLIEQGGDLWLPGPYDSEGKMALPAFNAARRGRKDLVQVFLSNGFEVGTLGEGGWTLAHYAASHSHGSLVRWLVSQGAELDALTTSGETPLELAVREGHSKTVELLVSLGAALRPNPNSEDDTVWMSLAEHAKPEILSVLVKAELVPAPELTTPEFLQAIVRRDEAVDLLGVLNDHGVDLASFAKMLSSLATKKDDWDLLELTLELGELGEDDLNALAFLAAGHGSWITLSKLLEVVDPNVRTPAGVPLIQFAFCPDGCAVSFETGEREPAAWDPGILRLILSARADTRATDASGRTALSWASRLGFSEVVKALLDEGCAAQSAGCRGALEEALEALLEDGEEGSRLFMDLGTTIQVLLDRGADVDIAVQRTREALRNTTLGGGAARIMRRRAFYIYRQHLGDAGAELADHVAKWVEHARLGAEAAGVLVTAGHRPSMGVLIAMMEHEDPRARQNATWVAGELGRGRDVMEALESRLKDPQPYVRLAAVAALEKLQDSAASNGLRRAADDQDRHVRRAAARALKRVDPRAAIDLGHLANAPLKEQLLDSLSVAWPDREFGPHTGPDRLLESECEARNFPSLAPTSPELPYSESSRKRLISRGARIVVDRDGFSELARGTPPGDLSTMIRALGDLEQVQPNVGIIDDLLAHADLGVRRAAVHLLGAMCPADGPDLAVRQRLVSLIDGEPLFATEAALAAGRCDADSGELKRVLWRAAEVAGAPARVAAVSSLALLSSVTDDRLAEVLPESKGEARYRIAWSLSGLRFDQEDRVPDGIIEALREALEDDREVTRCHAARAIGEWGRGEPWNGFLVVPLLDDASWSVRAQAALSLRRLRLASGYSLGALEARIEDPDLWVRKAVAIALRNHHDAGDLIERLERALGEDADSKRLLAETIEYVGWESSAAIGVLLRFFDDPNPAVQLAALEAVPNLGRVSERAATHLARLSGAEDSKLRARAIAAAGLALLERPEWFGLMLTGLSDATSEVRVEAEKALLKRGLKSRDELIELLAASRRSPQVQAAVTHVIRNQGTVLAAWLDEEVRAAHPWAEAILPEEAHVLHGVDAKHRDLEVPYNASQAAVLVATWCGYSDHLVAQLSDPRVQYFIRPYNLTFLYLDEKGKIFKEVEDGILSEEEASIIIAQMEEGALPIDLYDASALEKLPERPVFILDEAHVPLVPNIWTGPERSFPAVYHAGEASNGFAWLHEKLPYWLRQELDFD